MPTVHPNPRNLLYQRTFLIDHAKWTIPQSIFDLDHVDPIDLVAEYSNDETMSVDLIATRMAIMGIFQKSDSDGGVRYRPKNSSIICWILTNALGRW